MRHVVHTGETRNKNFRGKTYKPLGRYRHGLKNIEMVLNRALGVDYIYMMQYRDQWQALVNMVMTLQICSKFCCAAVNYVLASQQGLCSVESVILS